MTCRYLGSSAFKPIEPHFSIMFFLVFELVISLAAIATNCVALIAMVRCHQYRMVGYRRFLVSMCSGNIFLCCINLFAVALETTSQFASEMQLLFNCGSLVIRKLTLCAFAVALLNICGITVDLLIGIVSPIIALNWVWVRFLYSSCSLSSTKQYRGRKFQGSAPSFHGSSASFSVSWKWPTIGCVEDLVNISFSNSRYSYRFVHKWQHKQRRLGWVPKADYEKRQTGRLENGIHEETDVAYSEWDKRTKRRCMHYNQRQKDLARHRSHAVGCLLLCFI